MVTLYTLNNKLVKVGSKFMSAYDSSYPFESIKIGNHVWMLNTLNLKRGPNNTLVPVTEEDTTRSEVMSYDFTRVNKPDLGLQVYYSQQEAKAIADLIPGWHLPSLEEWITLRGTTTSLLRFTQTIKYIGMWDSFVTDVPTAINDGDPPKHINYPPYYWTSTEVTGEEFKSFNATFWNNLTPKTVTLVSDPSNQYWVNLPVRLIKD